MDGKPSIKTNQNPGGNSNFSLGWANDTDANKNVPSKTFKNHQTSNIFGDAPEEKKAPVRNKPNYGESSIKFGDYEEKKPPSTT
jgi:hypothetical protein